jgi:hypothetical protein
MPSGWCTRSASAKLCNYIHCCSSAIAEPRSFGGRSPQLLPKVSGLQVELSLVPLYEGQLLFDEMIAMLTGMGFELWSLIPGFVNQKTGRLLQVDGLFSRRDN